MPTCVPFWWPLVLHSKDRDRAREETAPMQLAARRVNSRQREAPKAAFAASQPLRQMDVVVPGGVRASRRRAAWVPFVAAA